MAVTFYKVASATLTSSAGTIGATSIPDTYDALMFFLSARVDLSAARSSFGIAFNNNTSNYVRSEIYLENDTGGVEVNYTNNQVGGVNASQANSGLFTNYVGFLPNYKTSSNKTMWIRTGQPNNTSLSYGIWQTFVTWKDSTPISSIYATSSGTNLVAGTELIVYGIKYS